MVTGIGITAEAEKKFAMRKIKGRTGVSGKKVGFSPKTLIR